MSYSPLPSHLVNILTTNRNSRQALNHREELWIHFEPFLAEKGYELAWDGDSMPPPNLPVAPNPFAPKPGEAFSAATAGRAGIKWGGPRANLCLMGAYDRFRRFVVVKIMSSNSNELGILQRLTAPTARRDPQNRTIPVLANICAGEWTFIVMPSWELSLREVVPVSRPSESLAIAVQCLKGLAYMHRQKVAHLDVYPSNILCNHVANRPASPFLRAFDFRLAYIDFEFSRSISGGAPSIDARYLPPTYHNLPEIRAGAGRVDPFAADVYALGRTLQGHFQAQVEYEHFHRNVDPTSRTLPQRYLRLVEGMTAEDPSGRPTALQALDEAQDIAASL